MHFLNGSCQSRAARLREIVVVYYSTLSKVFSLFYTLETNGLRPQTQPTWEFWTMT